MIRKYSIVLRRVEINKNIIIKIKVLFINIKDNFFIIE